MLGPALRVLSLHGCGRLLIRFAVFYCLLPAALAQTPKKIVGYYYGKGRPDYRLSDVPAENLTHLIYSHAVPTVQGNCAMSHPDVDGPNLQSFKTLKAKNPGLLVLLSVGGWSGSKYFSDVAATRLARSRFSASCVAILKRYGLDGLDIDWEYPVTGGKATDHKSPHDKGNFVLLLRQLRNDLDALSEHVLLTIASTGYHNHLNDLSLQEMANILDWFNLMGYDFNEMEPERTFHHSALFGWPATSNPNRDAAEFANSDAAVRWYLDHGVPPAKIVLGLPFYGHAWAEVRGENNGLLQPYLRMPGEDGTLSYREIEQAYLPAYVRYWDDQAKVPWLYNKKTRIMISYEDPESIAAKAKYVMQRQLGGIMFWDLGQDDSRATLLRAVHEGVSEPGH